MVRESGPLPQPQGIHLIILKQAMQQYGLASVSDWPRDARVTKF